MPPNPPTIPPEWAGIWTTQDSTYDCTGVFKSLSTFDDTLCAGQSFEPDTSITCSGSSTSTTFDLSCSGTGEVFTDCQ